LPIPPDWIEQGSPFARAATLTESPDTLLTSGVWDCTAGTFRWMNERDEIVHIVEGEVRVRDGSTTHVLVPGSVAYFPAGLETTWDVPKYVKKAFILRRPKISCVRLAAWTLKERLKAFATGGLPVFAFLASE
jgi:uncharacterized cupin superfamily protein